MKDSRITNYHATRARSVTNQVNRLRLTIATVIVSENHEYLSSLLLTVSGYNYDLNSLVILSVLAGHTRC